MDDYIQRKFDSFAKQVFGDITKGQYDDLRRTFFAGSVVMFELSKILSPGDDASPADQDLVRSVFREVIEFNDAVKRGEK